MVSAACPSCKILLVEATSASNANLGAAVNEAVKLGASVVSNSYGGSESSSDPTYDTKYYNHSGVLVVASSGDNGYGVEYPAASPFVLAVGGTSLTKSTNSRGWTEGAWADAGSGCSKYGTKPTWQKDAGCSKRTVADVSAVADPNTGVAVYDTYGGVGGWLVFGGTSVASPLVAAIFARSGVSAKGTSFPYAHTSAFNDVTTGSNGTCSASAKYLCTAAKGYDGPTGLGTTNGKSLSAAK
jgi:subtilase family serine protease